LKSRKSHLAHFNAWCVEHGIEQPQNVMHAHVEAFQRHLFRYRRKDGQPMTASGQASILGGVNVFFSWMVKHRHLPSNPACDVELPRVPKGLRDPMTASEVEAVLALPNLEYAQGLRDRAMLELLYGTGIRRMELAALNTADIERERGTLHVRRGKGGKGRFVPIGERALAWVTKYETEARPLLQGDPHEPALFLNIEGKRLSMNAMSWRADIALANRLAHAVLGRSLDELPPQTRRVLSALDGWVGAQATAQGIARAAVQFTRRHVRGVLGLSDTQLRVHLERLVTLDYVALHGGKPGQRFAYSLLFDGDSGSDAPQTMGLSEAGPTSRGEGPTSRPETATSRGPSANLAGGSRPGRGGVAGRLRGGQIPLPAKRSAASKGTDALTSENARDRTRSDIVAVQP
jgi:site-specific recombinase XerD